MKHYRTALYARLMILAREHRRYILTKVFDEKIENLELVYHPGRLMQCLGARDEYHASEPLYAPMFGGYKSAAH